MKLLESEYQKVTSISYADITENVKLIRNLGTLWSY